MTHLINNSIGEKSKSEEVEEFLIDLLGEDVSFSADFRGEELIGINIDGDITPEQEQQILAKYPELSQG